MLSSPLHYSKLLGGATIDLSQLVMVGDAFFIEDDYDFKQPMVGFAYRFGSGKDPIIYKRVLIEGPERDHNFNILHPTSRLCDNLPVEEYYRVRISAEDFRSMKKILVGEDGQQVALTRMQQQVDNLRAAWVKWKEAEPEVYAIIRKHLSA